MQQWKAFFVGDVYLAPGGAKDLFSAGLKKIIGDCDVVGCNFEAPVTDSTAKPIRKAGPVLRHEEFAAEHVLAAGFNVINLANNHIGDFGSEGVIRTLDAFSGVLTPGAGNNGSEAYELKVHMAGTVRVGFLSFAEWGFGCIEIAEQRPGYAWVNAPGTDTAVSSSRAKCDVLIVQVHAGVEEVPVPLPEWRHRYRTLIDLGADIVIAHHPHTSQGWESYKGKPIFYSLGNFWFDMENPSAGWDSSLGVSLTFEGPVLANVRVLQLEKTGDGVIVSPDEQIAALCSMLDEPRYSEEVDRLVVELWSERYQPYYTFAVNGLPAGSSLRNLARSMKAWALKSDPVARNLMLLHNLKIESHRYCVERALALLTQ